MFQTKKVFRPDHFPEMNLTCYHPLSRYQHPQFYLAEDCEQHSEAADQKENAVEAAAEAVDYCSVVAAAAVTEPFLTAQNQNLRELE